MTKLIFEEALERDNSVSIHHRNIRFLKLKYLKFFRGATCQIAKETFQFRDATPYQLKKQTDFQIPSENLDFSGPESIKFIGSKIWEILPDEIKQLQNL